MVTAKKDKLFLLKIFIYFIVIGYIILLIFQFIDIKNKTIDGFNNSVNVLTSSLKDRLGSIDRIYYALELSIENDLKNIATDMYEQNNKAQITQEYLNALKSDNELIDLYIIDENNTVIMTTFEPDLGLSFNFSSTFSEYLDFVRSEKKYISERINLSTLTSKINKYAYYPSDDGKYIFEVSYDMSSFSNMLGTDSFENFSSGMMIDESFIERLLVYNHFGNNFDNNISIDDIDDEQRKNAFYNTKETHLITTYESKKFFYTTTTKFIPYIIENDNLSNTIFVLELSYNDKHVIDSIFSWVYKQLLTLLIMIIVLFVTKWYYNRKMIEPLSTLLEAFDSVNENDFSVKVPIKGNHEIATAIGAFNNMVENIRNLIKNKEDNENNLKDLLTRVENGYFETVRTLANAIDAKDKYTSSHCERVMEMSLLLGDYLGISEEDKLTIKYGSLLHDIGKIGIVDRVLNKKGKFTESEYNTIKKHPQIGFEIIKDIDFLNSASEIVISHHERIDGNGYPNMLIDHQIPFLAKITAITDAFDAMTSERIYKKQILTVKEAFNELIRCSGTQFDSELVKKFILAYTDIYGTELDYLAAVIENKVSTNNSI